MPKGVYERPTKDRRTGSRTSEGSSPFYPWNPYVLQNRGGFAKTADPRFAEQVIYDEALGPASPHHHHIDEWIEDIGIRAVDFQMGLRGLLNPDSNRPSPLAVLPMEQLHELNAWNRLEWIVHNLN